MQIQFSIGRDDFAGIYLVGKFPQRCFVGDDKVLFSCPVVDTLYPVMIDLKRGSVRVFKNFPNLLVLDVSENFFVAAKSSFSHEPQLVSY